MIHKLAKLGRIIPPEMFPENPLGLKKEYDVDTIVFLNFSFDKENEEWKYNGMSMENYNQRKVEKYLFKTFKGRATSEFPTIDVYKTEDLLFDDKVSFTKSKKGKELVYILSKYDGKFDVIVQKLKNEPLIHDELKQKVENIGNRFALSVKFDGKYPGDSEWIAPKVELLTNREGKKEYYTYKGKKYETTDKRCSVTGEIEDTIWGYVTPHKDYKFYAVKTEIGAVPGGFDAKTAWKNFPVSPQGAKHLERGAMFMEEHLKFRFCGFNYFLIPERILQRGDDRAYLEDLQDFKTFKSGGEDEVNRTLEDDLLELLKENKNSANYTLFFYEINNAEFKILAVIEDVFPSYFGKIFDTKNAAESHGIFKNLKSQDKPYDIRFNFSDLKTFFPATKPFLELVRSIFMQKETDYSYLLSAMIAEIRADFSNGRNTRNKTLKAFLILKLLQNLQLIHQPKTGKNVTMENKYEAFFEEHSESFDSPTIKGVFLEGVLAKRLLNIQYKRHQATPFQNRLNSLKINKSIVQRLLPEIIDKLEAYDRNTKSLKDLEAEISKYLLKSNFDAISDTELSFYFTLGMNLASEFDTESDKKQNAN